MRNLGIAITTIVASLLLAGTASAATINVPGDHTLIQDAINASSDGDVIIVAPGTYTSTQDDHVVDMKGKAVTLRASGTPEETIIDGENTRGGIGCFNDETDATVIEGFTISNGTYGDGGGIFISGSSPYIANCIVTNNSGTLGGGIYCGGQSNPTISGCTISGNTASWDGGGITCAASNPTIIGCTISDNTAVDSGGGIFCSSSNPTITACNIMGNWATLGGGIFSYASNPILTGCAVCGNSPDQIIGPWNNIGGNTVESECSHLIGACCTGNELVCVPNAFEDDCLAYGGQWLGEGSACDDCPPPVEPEVLGACCLNGGCVPSTAEGCFEGGGSYAGDDVSCADAGCPEVCPGDLTGDNQVTIMDLLFVLDAWGATCP